VVGDVVNDASVDEAAVDEAAVDEAAVDGEMAHEEDAREHRAAEAAVEEDGEEEEEEEEQEEEAVQLDAVAVQPASRAGASAGRYSRPAAPAPHPAPSRYAFQHGKGGKQVPKRRRKVLRDNIQGIVRAPRLGLKPLSC
jgi:hypothetical protein